ncbi:hypothetical protein FA95DRAFT_1607265 [Auriscalpium vulgare]|uniref:Uncharacterized protein n=1 Tax=Auriscalpium vulgare TaxID=40419 RepID=A0ACB8RP75_9AGAM|nr:hypothetical protein FA95DRAFT_1607265 [Auriscalpium vulgare]
MSSALDVLEIKAAIDNTNLLNEIGYCPTKIRLTRRQEGHARFFHRRKRSHQGQQPDEMRPREAVQREDVENAKELEEVEVEVEAEKEQEYKDGKEEEKVLLDRDDELQVTANEIYVQRLARLYHQAPVFDSGRIEHAFPLTIYRGNVQTKIIQPAKRYTFDEDCTEWLRSLYDMATVSGLSDMRTQETAIDAAVQNAREIPATDFSVPPALLAEVRQLWAARMYPRAVRVVPHKILMHRPGGHLNSHPDTPEKGLVGTFLLGVGDTTWENALRLAVPTERQPAELWDPDQEQATEVEDEGNRAETKDSYDSKQSNLFGASPGDWVAFYPDLPHRVDKVVGGYRAVIAFKIFHDSDSHHLNNDPPCIDPALVERVTTITDKLQPPFGLLLGRKYSLGRKNMSGFDAVVYEALARRAGVSTHLLPVIVKHSARLQLNSGLEPVWRRFEAPVYPFTEVHVRALADGVKDGFRTGFDMECRDHDSPELPGDLAWLKRLDRDVQFMALDFSDATVKCGHHEDDDHEYRGNEARHYSEDSTYLSYALVALPSKGSH